MGRVIDLAGQKFGKLTVLERSPNTRRGEVMWLCRCECGKESSRTSGALRYGRSTSCRKCASTKHGSSRDVLYFVWVNMLKRCRDAQDNGYKNYGARGIGVCEEWNDINVFLRWAYSHGYERGLTIDRIDNNGNYCPENCRWADDITQHNNRRDNHILTIGGVSKTVAEWARVNDLDYDTLLSRIRYGWKNSRLLIQSTRKQRGDKIAHR